MRQGHFHAKVCKYKNSSFQKPKPYQLPLLSNKLCGAPVWKAPGPPACDEFVEGRAGLSMNSWMRFKTVNGGKVKSETEKGSWDQTRAGPTGIRVQALSPWHPQRHRGPPAPAETIPGTGCQPGEVFRDSAPRLSTGAGWLVTWAPSAGHAPPFQTPRREPSGQRSPLSILFLPFMLLVPYNFPPILPLSLPADNPPCDFHVYVSVPVLVVCLGCFLDSVVHSCEFIAILLFIVLIFFFLDKSL